MTYGPSTHLSWEELACKDGTEYPKKWRISRAIPLSLAFEKIRKYFGDKPIQILSSYRTPSHNKSIGGAKYSQHMEGRALDLRPPKGISVAGFYQGIRSNAKEFGITGIGLYATFVHIDIRPTKLITWTGSGMKDDNT